MTPARGGKASADDGYILVAVLSVMLLLTGFMAAGSLLVRSALDTAKIADADAPMAGLTRAGLELAAYQLFVIKAAPEAVEGRRIKFGGGIVVPHIVDEGGKADVNASDPTLLAAIFRGAGLDASVADALLSRVIERRGVNRNPAPNNVSPAPSGSVAVKRRRGFQSIAELCAVPGLSHDDLRALEPLLTVYNPDGRINILSASRATLLSIPGVSPAEVDVILARRDNADKAASDQLVEMLKAKDVIKTDFGPVFSVRIDATSSTGRKKAVNAVVAASKSPNEPYYVLDWW